MEYKKSLDQRISSFMSAQVNYTKKKKTIIYNTRASFISEKKKFFLVIREMNANFMTQNSNEV